MKNNIIAEQAQKKEQLRWVMTISQRVEELRNLSHQALKDKKVIIAAGYSERLNELNMLASQVIHEKKRKNKAR